MGAEGQGGEGGREEGQTGLKRGGGAAGEGGGAQVTTSFCIWRLYEY